MSLQLTEGVLDATLAYIRDRQEAKLAEVLARPWAVELALPAFKALRLSEPDRESEVDFPVMYAVPDTARDERPSKGGAAGGWVHRVEFVVMAWHPGLGFDELLRPGNGKIIPSECAKRMSGRYALAVYEMLKEMSKADASYHFAGDAVRWGSGGVAPEIVYGITYANSAGAQLADARLLMAVEHYETRD